MTYLQDYRKLHQGEDRDLRVALYDHDGLPLAGFGAYTFIFRIVAARGDRSALLQKTEVSGITVDAPNNRITIAFDKADTQTMDAGDYWMECRMDNGADETVLFEGLFTLLPSSTV